MRRFQTAASKTNTSTSSYHSNNFNNFAQTSTCDNNEADVANKDCTCAQPPQMGVANSNLQYMKFIPMKLARSQSVKFLFPENSVLYSTLIVVLYG